jgi:hypothetical protein
MRNKVLMKDINLVIDKNKFLNHLNEVRLSIFEWNEVNSTI